MQHASLQFYSLSLKGLKLTLYELYNLKMVGCGLINKFNVTDVGFGLSLL
jgi:hypothetical protein